MSYLHSIPRSFGYAWAGFKTAFKNEPNFRVHIIAATAVTVTGVMVGLSSVEWAILVITVALVLILELVNTSIEAIVNMLSPNQSDGARIAKDTAAASVFIASLAACVVGICIFGSKLV